MSDPRIEPRIAVLDPAAPRLDAPPDLLPADLPPPAPQIGSLAFGLAGVAVLILGLGGLSVGNFVADQFARAVPLGWATLAVAGLGGGLVGAGILRELRGLFRLEAVDRLRARLANPDTTREAALDWLANLPDAGHLAGTIRIINDPDTILALLRDGPAAGLREKSEKLGRDAAIGVFALTAAIPTPTLDAMVVAWRGIRLIREVAALHGMRPGLIATTLLLRRTLMAAGMSAFTNVAVDTAFRALLSHPTLAHFAGDAAGASVAARRMIVLSRAANAACSPLPSPP